MVMPEHTAKAFDVDLQELTRMVAEMGGMAEKQIAESIDALARRDSKLAQRVVALDPSVDGLQREIEERRCLQSRAANRWPSTCARLSARYGSQTISSVLATSPKTLPSA